MNENTLEWVESVLVDCGELRAADVRELSDREWFGASIDSRGNCSRRLFVALAGDNTDGHRFVANAIDSGAAAVIVSEQKAADNARDLGAPAFVVKNTLLALQAIASAYRATLNMRVVAVTGSAGKTTTKEYIRAILKRKYRVHSSPGNYNNHIGVPLTLLETDPDCEYLVAEIGANHAGEIDFLSTMLRPDIGVVTNVGDAHIGLFGSRDRIAEAKAELFSGIDEEGYAVLPADDDYFDLLRGHCRCRVMSYGTAADARFRVSDVRRDDEGVIAFDINGEALSIRSHGEYNVLNAAAAYAVGDISGVEPERAREALADCEPMAGRARVHEWQGIVLVDDSYNASPSSMRASISALANYPGKRRVVVLGDMGELGAFTEDAHRDLGAFVAAELVDTLWWAGRQGAVVEAGLKGAKGNQEFRSFPDATSLADALVSSLQVGDIVLVKASRSSQLDAVVRRIRESVFGEG